MFLLVSSIGVVAPRRLRIDRRGFWVSGSAGVRDPKDQPGLIGVVMVMLLRRFARDVLEDAIRAVNTIQKSELDWIIVRAPMLVDGPFPGRHRVGYVGKGRGRRLYRGDLADFMLRQLTEDRYLHKMPVVSS